MLNKRVIEYCITMNNEIYFYKLNEKKSHKYMQNNYYISECFILHTKKIVFRLALVDNLTGFLLIT